jgi:hypothetical protein
MDEADARIFVGNFFCLDIGKQKGRILLLNGKNEFFRID